MSEKSGKGDAKNSTAAKADAAMAAGVIASATEGMSASQKAEVSKALGKAVEKAK